MQVMLAENDCTGRTQPADHLGVFGNNTILELRAGGGGPYTRCIDDVFQPDRDSVQPPAIVPTLDFLFGQSRLGKRGVRHDGDVGVQLWIELLDPRQAVMC